jgi:ankyrin repeat protein
MSCAAPQDGLMPLHAASVCGHLEVVGALLARGADVEAKERVSIARDALSESP